MFSKLGEVKKYIKQTWGFKNHKGLMEQKIAARVAATGPEINPPRLIPLAKFSVTWETVDQVDGNGRVMRIEPLTRALCINVDGVTHGRISVRDTNGYVPHEVFLARVNEGLQPYAQIMGQPHIELIQGAIQNPPPDYSQALIVIETQHQKLANLPPKVPRRTTLDGFKSWIPKPKSPAVAINPEYVIPLNFSKSDTEQGE